MSLRPVAARLALLAAAALVVPACGKHRTGPNDLFSDGFGGAFPGTSWTTPVVGGTGSAAVDGTVGNPAPSLALTGAANNGDVTTETTLAFTSPPLTVSVQMAVPAAGRGIGTVSIVDASPAVVASAAWDADAGTLDFEIGATAVSVAAPAADGAFHTLSFSVDASGNATWFLDGSVQLAGTGFPAGDVTVRLSGDWPGGGGAFATLLIDNVRVMAP